MRYKTVELLSKLAKLKSNAANMGIPRQPKWTPKQLRKGPKQSEKQSEKLGSKLRSKATKQD